LTLNGNKDFVKETTWLTSETASGTEGGGGGVSQFHALPSYQVGVISAASKGSTSFRNVPDVSLEADPNVGYIVIVTRAFLNFLFNIVGLTSLKTKLRDRVQVKWRSGELHVLLRSGVD